MAQVMALCTTTAIHRSIFSLISFTFYFYLKIFTLHITEVYFAVEKCLRDNQLE